MHKDQISTLNDLIETCKDGEQGFKTAAGGLKDPATKAKFQEYSRQRADMVRELQAEVRKLGGDPETAGSVSGSLHRGWIDQLASMLRDRYQYDADHLIVLAEQPAMGERRALQPRQLGIEEAQVELGVVDHQRGIADEFHEPLEDLGEARLVRQEGAGQPVHRLRVGRHVAFRVEIGLELPSGGQVVDQLETGDLDDPVTGQRIKAGRFGIEDDLAHSIFLAGFPAVGRHVSTRRPV